MRIIAALAIALLLMAPGIQAGENRDRSTDVTGYIVTTASTIVQGGWEIAWHNVNNLGCTSFEVRFPNGEFIEGCDVAARGLATIVDNTPDEASWKQASCVFTYEEVAAGCEEYYQYSGCGADEWWVDYCGLDYTCYGSVETDHRAGVCQGWQYYSNNGEEWDDICAVAILAGQSYGVCPSQEPYYYERFIDSYGEENNLAQFWLAGSEHSRGTMSQYSLPCATMTLTFNDAFGVSKSLSAKSCSPPSATIVPEGEPEPPIGQTPCVKVLSQGVVCNPYL